MEESEKVVTFKPGALVNLRNMQSRCGEIRATHGESSEGYLKAVESLVMVLETMIGLGGTIYPEDDLSVLGVSFITYGVIWHSTYVDGKRDELLGTWSVHS